MSVFIRVMKRESIRFNKVFILVRKLDIVLQTLSIGWTAVISAYEWTRIGLGNVAVSASSCICCSALLRIFLITRPIIVSWTSFVEGCIITKGSEHIMANLAYFYYLNMRQFFHKNHLNTKLFSAYINVNNIKHCIMMGCRQHLLNKS